MVLISDAMLSRTMFQIPGNPTLRVFLEGLRCLVVSRHCCPPSMQVNRYMPDNIHPGAEVTQEKFDAAAKSHQRRLEDLNNYNMMICQFEMALSDEWPPSDRSRCQRLVPSTSVVYPSNIGSREHIEESDLSLSSKRRC